MGKMEQELQRQRILEEKAQKYDELIEELRSRVSLSGQYFLDDKDYDRAATISNFCDDLLSDYGD